MVVHLDMGDGVRACDEERHDGNAGVSRQTFANRHRLDGCLVCWTILEASSVG